MSKYQLNIAYFYSIPIGNIQILVSNMYVLLYENLQLYLRLGLKLKNIYLVLEFNQPRWSKQYIEFNTKKEIKMEKHFCKLMNNAVYEKRMENLKVTLMLNKPVFVRMCI